MFLSQGGYSVAPLTPSLVRGRVPVDRVVTLPGHTGRPTLRLPGDDWGRRTSSTITLHQTDCKCVSGAPPSDKD